MQPSAKKNQESGKKRKATSQMKKCDRIELHRALKTNHTAKVKTVSPRRGRSRAKRRGEIGGNRSIETRPGVGARRRPSSSNYQLFFLRLPKQSFSPLEVGVAGGTNRRTSEKCQDTDCLCTKKMLVMMLIQMKSQIALKCTASVYTDQ